MPLPHFLILLLTVIALAGITVFALQAFGLSMGLAGLIAVAAALAVRALAWR